MSDTRKLEPLTESIKTQIAYLMQGLLRAPSKKHFEELLDKVENFNGSFPSPVARALDAVLLELPERGKLGASSLQRAAGRLFKSRSDEAKQAGLALLWGLENVKPWPGTALPPPPWPERGFSAVQKATLRPRTAARFCA